MCIFFNNKEKLLVFLQIRSFILLTMPKADSGNAIAVVAVSCVAFICLALLAGLLVKHHIYIRVIRSACKRAYVTEMELYFRGRMETLV